MDPYSQSAHYTDVINIINSLILTDKYDGDGTLNRIIDIGFCPRWLQIDGHQHASDVAVMATKHITDLDQDKSTFFKSTGKIIAYGVDGIGVLTERGFTVGGSGAGKEFNKSGWEYHFIALRGII